MLKIRKSIFSETGKFISQNKAFDRILLFIMRSGIGDFFYRVFSKKYLKERKNYFYSKKIYNKWNENINYLYDEKSKKIYKSLIEYRSYRNRKYFPEKDDNKIYFPKDIYILSENECFIDCGVFIGDTIEDFLKECNGKYNTIIGFEPDNNNFLVIPDEYKNNPNITIFNSGCYSETKKINFLSNIGEASRICDNSNDAIQVYKLDDIEECKNASFIKMDIEGCELEALKGAKNIIRSNKPKLAICIYHSDEDMISIINYVHELVPEYRIFVRHYGDFELETVMYAVMGGE